MAEHASDFTPGQMDVHQQEASFHGFMLLTKWGALAVASIVPLLVIWFCTDAGFLPALITAVIIAALGIFFLREKDGPAAGH